MARSLVEFVVIGMFTAEMILGAALICRLL